MDELRIGASITGPGRGQDWKQERVGENASTSKGTLSKRRFNRCGLVRMLVARLLLSPFEHGHLCVSARVCAKCHTVYSAGKTLVRLGAPVCVQVPNDAYYFGMLALVYESHNSRRGSSQSSIQTVSGRLSAYVAYGA